MRNRVSRLVIAASLVFGGAYLCASGNLACGSLATEAAVSGVDFCFIFDCTDGAFGGAIDPCGAVVGSDLGPPRGAGGAAGGGADTTDPLDFLGGPGGPLFSDCVNVSTTDGP